jgi:hypothetical protein
MPSFDAFSGGSGSVMTWIVVILLAVLALYLTRGPAHSAIRSMCRVLHAAFRMASIAIFRAETRLGERNREVLLAAGRDLGRRKAHENLFRSNVIPSRSIEHCASTLYRSILRENPSAAA